MADTFPDLDSAMVVDLYDELGETITYNGESVVAVPNVTYKQIGRDATAVEAQRTFSVRYADVPEPSRGDVINYDEKRYTVDVALQIDEIEFMVLTH